MRNLWPMILAFFLIPIFIPISVQAVSLHVPILTYHYIANNPISLPSLSYAAALKQLIDSKNIIQANTGYPVNFVAYPNGATNGSVQAVARQAGYAGGLGTWYGKAWGASWNMPRIKVSGYWSIQEFAARL